MCNYVSYFFSATVIRLIFANFRSYFKIEPLKSRFGCHICSKSFSSLGKLKYHRLRHQEKRFTCSFCNKKFFIHSLLRKHIRLSHEKPNDLVCEFCDYKSSDSNCFKSHVVNNHTKDYKLKCNLCDKGFLYKGNLRRHNEVQHEGVRFFCTFCSKNFKTERYFEEHFKQHDPLCEETKLSCPKCSKTVNKHVFKRHLEIHNEDRKKYVCDVCGKNLLSLEGLKFHKKMHIGDKNYACDVCGKAFLTKQKLVIHTRTHNGKKPFMCKECHKRFTRKYSLTIHVTRYHTSENPHKCEFCLKQFVSKGNLKKHKCSRSK